MPRPTTYRKAAPDAPRVAAYDCLRAVASRDAYANLVLPALLRERGLEGRDAAFATELTYGTLRGLGSYDAVLGACSDRPLESIDPELRDVLRLGAHQLIGGMRVPPHAAVGATVELARAVVGQGRAGFANAVLRKVGTRTLEEWVEAIAPSMDSDPVEHLALAHAHPAWIVRAYADVLGADWDEVGRALAAGNVRPGVHYVARPGRIDRDALAVEVGGTAGPWSPYAVHAAGGNPGDVPAIRSGDAGVQDEGSQLVALIASRIPVDGTDNRWLDLCAGPGGKAALLAGLGRERAAHLVANEVAGHRATLVKQSMRGEYAVTVVQADGRAPAWRAGSFDRVLADVPCSGLGALRRRPEARWRKQPSDIAALRPLQSALLDSAVEAVRAGGALLYATCSPHLAETTAVVAAGLRRHRRLEQVDVRELLPGMPELGAGPSVQLWPHRHGTDGMFLAGFVAH